MDSRGLGWLVGLAFVASVGGQFGWESGRLLTIYLCSFRIVTFAGNTVFVRRIAPISYDNLSRNLLCM